MPGQGCCLSLLRILPPSDGAPPLLPLCRYEDDRDEGEWFLYTGSGGRDLSGNKRTNKEQSFDQVGRQPWQCQNMPVLADGSADAAWAGASNSGGRST